MVPEVGLESVAQVQGSIDAMAEFTARLLTTEAETVVLISPHGPLEPDAFVAYGDPQLYGDFSNFRAPKAQVAAPLDEELLRMISKVAGHSGYALYSIVGHELDHGITVPLYFLLQHGWRGQVIALGYSFLSNEDHVQFGLCIQRAIEDIRRPVAFVASGDLSHRLKPEAPAGYNPEAFVFDEEVVTSIREGDLERIINLDPKLRRLAGECGYRSMLVAFGVVQGLPLDCEVLHYEAPFGVGYLVAQLTNRNSGSRSVDQIVIADDLSNPEDLLPRLARQAVETYVIDGIEITPSATSLRLLNAPGSCFVCIRTTSGELRGCIGTIDPVKPSLAHELITNAIHAATRDPRFPPITADELPDLRYSVDILMTPEPALVEDLDPAIYGVIVEDDSGLRRGLLLPAIEGVDTVTKQVEIASRKAGIMPGESVRLLRFRVDRFRER